MPKIPSRRGAKWFALATGAVLVATVSGCSALDVSDPTKVSEENIDNATGANLLRRRALYSLDQAEGYQAWLGGLVADEFTVHPGRVGAGPDYLDFRYADPITIEYTYYFLKRPYQYRVQGRYQATLALAKLAAFGQAASRDAYMGQMYAVRGYNTTRLGEDYCAGFPLHELNGYAPVYGPPLTTQQVFERALADLDSAVDLVADSARILNFARVVRGRTLLGLGRQAEAAAAVAGTPTDYVFNNGTGGNEVSFTEGGYYGETVADADGGVGIDFLAAADPRVATTDVGLAYNGVTHVYRPDKYSVYQTPIVMVSGIEARLIEAEAALAAGQPQWLTKLNELRTTCTDIGTCPTPAPAGTGGIAGLPPLADPGTDAARLDLLFRERAFWLFGTGHRLGDLRRLIDIYGRDPDTVFPNGPGYGEYRSLPFPDPDTEKGFSPGIAKCTSL